MQSLQLFLNTYRPLIMVMYLALVGMACVSAATVYLGISVSLWTGLVFMGFVFFIYIINRFTDIKEDFANDLSKAVFFLNRKALFKIGIAAIILAGISLAFVNKLSMFHVILISMGVLYSYRFIPWYWKGRGIIYYRIKDLPLIKNLVVSILWGTSVFVFPILFSEVRLNNTFIIAILITSITISTFTNTFFGDILDVVGDRLSKSYTFPSLFGESTSYKILFSVNLIWLAAVILLFKNGFIDIYHLAFLISVAFYPLAYIIPYQRKWLKRTGIDFLMELDLLLIACGLALLSLTL